MRSIQLFKTGNRESLRHHVYLASALAVIAILVTVSSATDGSGAGAEPEFLRWGNVRLANPSRDSGFVLVRDYHDETLTLTLRGNEHSVVINASNGSILHDDVPPGSRGEIDTVLATLSVLPDNAAVPWPYSEAPNGAIRQWIQGLSFIPPDPDSGILLVLERNYIGGNYLQFTNGHSVATISTHTGAADLSRTNILPEDEQAFTRLLSTIEVDSTP